MKKEKIILFIISFIGLMCFVAATMAFILNCASGRVILEGWLTALFSLYAKDRYRIYLNKIEKKRCKCYEEY